MKTNLVLLFVTVFILGSCKEKGCTDVRATNYEVEAEKDDGSCCYSKAVFYITYYDIQVGQNEFVPITSVDVFLDGNLLGHPTIAWSNGPGNCSADGTVSYQFRDGKTKDWNCRLYGADGTIFLTSGTVTPSGYNECIAVNVHPEFKYSDSLKKR